MFHLCAEDVVSFPDRRSVERNWTSDHRETVETVHYGAAAWTSSVDDGYFFLSVNPSVLAPYFLFVSRQRRLPWYQLGQIFHVKRHSIAENMVGFGEVAVECHAAEYNC